MSCRPHRTSIVLGLFFGDEGKGVTTSYLARAGDLVVRFNGGHQAGHTVIKDDHRHVFSSFGSGTLNDAHTYWSEYCTFYPKAFYNEAVELKARGIEPVVHVHPLCPITTPWDVQYNQNIETLKKHGSVGVGFGQTIDRHENSPYKLYAKDLLCKEMFLYKMFRIREFYSNLGVDTTNSEVLAGYLHQVDMVSKMINISVLENIKNNYAHIVFEGAQGILLDMDFGFFPHVTRSNTTSKNAMKIIEENRLPKPDIYYIMRSYLTRHGNGPLKNEAELKLINNEQETNKKDDWQGNFRTAYHSTELFEYALACDKIYSKNARKNFVITCLDQTDGKILLENKPVNVSDFLDYKTVNLFTSYDGKTLHEAFINQ